MTATVQDPRLVSKTDARKTNWELKQPNIYMYVDLKTALYIFIFILFFYTRS